ncbi:hypothetical protein Ndes2526B_g06017 [Nannochloris sp. 'desiccata']|nr:putative CCR4-NOT transcription complex subunit 4 [Chlorella desiccata (nom. nud.)]
MEGHGCLWGEDHRKRQEATCPICCDSILDEEELLDPFCSCGFQLCSFCLNRIQNESDNSCPHCRTSYDDGPQNDLYERLSKLVEQRKQAEKEARLSAREVLAHNGASATVSPAPNIAHTAPVHPPPPLPNMNLEEESMWPGLAAPAKPQKPPMKKKTRPLPAVPQSKSTNFRLPVLAETPVEYPSSNADWMKDNTIFPSNPTSSAPTASGTETPPSPSQLQLQSRAAGKTAVMVSYHGTANGIIPTTEPLFASGKCVINLDDAVAAAAAAQTGSLVNFESAALLNAMRDALRSGKITVQEAAATLMQHLEATSKIQTMNNNNVGVSTEFGMFSEQDSAVFNNYSGGSGGGGGGEDTTERESLFAGMSLYSKQTISPISNSISIPPGLSKGHSQSFGLNSNFGNNNTSGIDLDAGGGGGADVVQRGPPPGFQGTGFVYQ